VDFGAGDVVSDGVRGESSGEPGRSNKRSHRLGDLYGRGQMIVMLGAALGVVALVGYAYHLLTVKDPPASAEPVLQLVLDPGQQLSWAKTTEYQVFEKFSHCANPVTVEVDALVNGTDIGGPVMAPGGYVHGELTDALGVPAKFQLLETDGTFPQNWLPPQGNFVRHVGDNLQFGAPLRLWYPSALRIGTSAVQTRAVLVELRFQANWILPRSTGTCFVRFPTLQAPHEDPTDPPSFTVWAPAAGPGEVIVRSTTGDLVDSTNSLPPPTDPLIPQWVCASMATSTAEPYSATDCGGVAVFSTPGTDSYVALSLLIDGALIGVAAALFAEQVTEPLRNHKRESGTAQRPETG
jgi:hypothetical protein